MARAIVGGLLFSTFVSLLLLPTIYTWLDIMRHWPHKVTMWLKGLVLGYVERRRNRRLATGEAP